MSWRRAGSPLQYSCLENPIGRGPWWAKVHRVIRSQSWRKQLSMHALTNCIYMSVPTSQFIPPIFSSLVSTLIFILYTCVCFWFENTIDYTIFSGFHIYALIYWAGQKVHSDFSIRCYGKLKSTF